MTYSQLAFFGVINSMMLLRILLDNFSIAASYTKMSKYMASTLAITPVTTKAFKGFFKWCARTHYMMALVSVYSFAHWVVEPTLFTAVFSTLHLVIMLLIHAPQRDYAKLVVDRFFSIDVPELETTIKAKAIIAAADSGRVL
jgi:hypothetical protein